MEEEQVRVILREQSEKFRRLEEKHHQYAEELEAITNLVLPSAEEVRKEKDLKKRKLQIKDKIHQLIKDYQKTL